MRCRRAGRRSRSRLARTPVTPARQPTLGITRPVRHRPSGHKLSRPHMPQGLSAGPQRPTQPGLAGGQQLGDWPRASAPASARPRKRPLQCGQVSPPGTVPLEPQQRREQLVVAEPGPPRSQRHHETRQPPPAGSSTTPQNWPFCASRSTAGLPLRHAVFGIPREHPTAAFAGCSPSVTATVPRRAALVGPACSRAYSGQERESVCSAGLLRRLRAALA